MNNKMLSFAMILSAVILPAVASAGLINKTISHTGSLSVFGAQSITLSEHAGRSITLNNGSLDIQTTKVPMGFSVFTPKLVLKQNGQTMVIKVDAKEYYASDDESFDLLAKNSDLNYDLYLRRTTTSGKEFQSIKTEGCRNAMHFQRCENINGSINCSTDTQYIYGTQEVKNTEAEVTVTYKLTLGQNNVAKAEFTSSTTSTVVKKTEELTICR